MALSPQAKIPVLQTQISVMRDKMVERNNVYDHMTNRMFTLLGTEIAISGFLSSKFVGIPYPKMPAGKIFLFTAIGAIASSIFLLMFNYRTTKTWPSPMSETEVALMNKSSTELEALKVLYKDYRSAYQQAGMIIDPRAKSLNSSLIMFVVGVIILVVLKFGG